MSQTRTQHTLSQTRVYQHQCHKQEFKINVRNKRVQHRSHKQEYININVTNKSSKSMSETRVQHRCHKQEFNSIVISKSSTSARLCRSSLPVRRSIDVISAVLLHDAGTRSDIFGRALEAWWRRVEGTAAHPVEADVDVGWIAGEGGAAGGAGVAQLALLGTPVYTTLGRGKSARHPVHCFKEVTHLVHCSGNVTHPVDCSGDVTHLVHCSGDVTHLVHCSEGGDRTTDIWYNATGRGKDVRHLVHCSTKIGR